MTLTLPMGGGNIEQDGALLPVLLGVSPLPGPALDEERLRLTLVFANSDVPIERHESLAALAEKHWPAATIQAEQQFGRVNLKIIRNVVATRINEDLSVLGEARRVASGRAIERVQATAKMPESRKALVRSGGVKLWNVHSHKGGTTERRKRQPKKTGTLRDRPGRAEELGELAGIRAKDAECQYNSMLNAPAEKLNLPLIRRAEKIMEMLTELIALDPAKAVTQLPIERCRDFTVAHAAWWSEFARLCEERRATETPDLPPRAYRPKSSVLNPVVIGSSAIPMEERGLPPGERAVLDWIRTQVAPVTLTQVALGLRNRSRMSIRTRVSTLVASGLIEPVGKVGSETAYQAVAKENEA